MKEHHATDRITASAITLLTVIVVLVLMLLTHLRFTPPDNHTWPTADDSELLFTTDIAPIIPPSRATNTPSGLQSSAEKATDNGRDNIAVTSPDLTDGGAKAPQPTPPVSSTKPSDMKTPAPSEKTGPTAEQLEQQRKEAQREAETKAREAAIKKGFGSSNNKANSTSGGNTSGKVSAGSPTGQVGYNLAGRTMAGWGKALVTAPSGSITVTIKVDRQGKVVEAAYKSGTGTAAGRKDVRDDCVRRALTSHFSVLADAPPMQTGSITYTFTTAN